MDHFPPIFVTASYRTWSCSRTKASSHPLSTKIHTLFLKKAFDHELPSLLKTLLPLLPRTTSSSLRASIRKTILTDIKTANQRAKNHKLNRAVQTMLFGMVERGMGGIVMGDKGKLRSNPNTSGDGLSNNGDEAMWAVVMTKELWKKGVWSVPLAPVRLLQLTQYRDDAKSVAIVALGCFHPITKVQSASLHFFLGSDEESEDSEDESDVNVCSSLLTRSHLTWTLADCQCQIARA
jgi:protein SDA1